MKLKLLFLLFAVLICHQLLGMEIAQSEFDKQYLIRSEQEKKDTIEFHKKYEPAYRTPQEETDLFHKRVQLDAIQQEQQANATFREKAVAFGDIYIKNTIIGSIAEGLGITYYTVHAKDYPAQEGYKPDKSVIADFSIQYGANDDEIKNMMNSNSSNHLQALMENIVSSKKSEQHIANVLTTGQQKIAHIATFFDLGTLLLIVILAFNLKNIYIQHILTSLIGFVFFGIAIIFITISSVVSEYIVPWLMFGGLILSGILYILDKNKKKHFKKS